MKALNWKRVRAKSQPAAIRLCLDFAIAHHNRSVARVAELMGTSEWAIYKWMAKGSMPSDRIRPFEYACDPQGRATYLTQYIAAGSNKLLIDIPRGKGSTEQEVGDLQLASAEAMSLLMKFYRGEASPEDTSDALTELLSKLAWHRENVERSAQPELALFEDDEE